VSIFFFFEDFVVNKILLFSLITTITLMTSGAFAMEESAIREFDGSTPLHGQAIIGSIYISEEAKADGLNIYLNPTGTDNQEF
jgi:hypothetical protein